MTTRKPKRWAGKVTVTVEVPGAEPSAMTLYVTRKNQTRDAADPLRRMAKAAHKKLALMLDGLSPEAPQSAKGKILWADGAAEALGKYYYQ